VNDFLRSAVLKLSTLGAIALVLLAGVSIAVPLHGQMVCFDQHLVQFECVDAKMQFSHISIANSKGLVRALTNFQRRKSRLRFANQLTFQFVWRKQSSRSLGLPHRGARIASPNSYTVRRTHIVFPIWAAFLVLSIGPILALIIGLLRHQHRLRRMECLLCGYNLFANTSGICPECGTPIPKEVREKLAAGPPGSNAEIDTHGSQSVDEKDA